MCHPSVLEFVEKVLSGADVRGRDVLEVGSYDVNGSPRRYVESLLPRRYLGVDTQAGPGVDRIVDCEKLTIEIAGQWQVVISTEMLEHVRDWKTCVEQMVQIVTPGGLLLLTTRSPGFGYHPFPEDHWRYTCDDMYWIMVAAGMNILVLEDDWQYQGVFLLAHKPPVDWVLPAGYRKEWDEVKVMEVFGG